MPVLPGDYSALAADYAAHRAGYAPEVVAALLGLATIERKRAVERLDVVDVGAGTGIFSRMLARAGARVVAVEPNAAMREHAHDDPDAHPIRWCPGTAESTGLDDASADLVTMASAFHWADFDRATAEFSRVLRPRGVFAALWNTRVHDAHPILASIEAEVTRRWPDLSRSTSGRSETCETLAARLHDSGRFERVVYIEGHHVERMTPVRYVGLWRSVNGMRAAVGDAAFDDFIAWVERALARLDVLPARYATRAWAARKSGHGGAR